MECSEEWELWVEMADGGSEVRRRTQGQWISGAVDFYIFHIEGVPVDNHHFSKATRSCMTNVLLAPEQSSTDCCSGQPRHILCFISRTGQWFTQHLGSFAAMYKSCQETLGFHSECNFLFWSYWSCWQRAAKQQQEPSHLFACYMHGIASKQCMS